MSQGVRLQHPEGVDLGEVRYFRLDVGEGGHSDAATQTCEWPVAAGQPAQPPCLATWRGRRRVLQQECAEPDFVKGAEKGFVVPSLMRFTAELGAELGLVKGGVDAFANMEVANTGAESCVALGQGLDDTAAEQSVDLGLVKCVTEVAAGEVAEFASPGLEAARQCLETALAKCEFYKAKVAALSENFVLSDLDVAVDLSSTMCLEQGANEVEK